MKKVQQAVSLSEQAYQIIKEAIINGKLKEGEALPEERMAKQLGISRTPLRDAFHKLASEGLIEHRNNAPSIVASFTKEKSLEYMEIRLLLETDNIEKITPIISPAMLKSLRENLQAQKETIDNGSYTDFLEQNRVFHLILAEANPNEEMRKLIHQVNTGMSRAFILLSQTITQSADSAYQEHKQILAALEERNVSIATSYIREHLENVRKRFIDFGTHSHE